MIDYRQGPAVAFDVDRLADRDPVPLTAPFVPHKFVPQLTSGNCAACGQQRGHEIHREQRHG